MTLETVHASAVQIDGKGILILGPSGAGKSALALDLIDQCQLRGIPAKLIGDDRIVLKGSSGHFFACPAPPLAGLIEVRGSGIHAIDHVPEALLHLSVLLVKEEDAIRMPPQEAVEILPGVFLPQLKVPRGQPAIRAVFSRLGLYGGVKTL